MSENIGWDEFETEAEEVTKEEAETIDRDDLDVPIGLFQCVVVDSKPKQIDFNGYSCLGTTLKFEIEECLEIDAKPIEKNEGKELIGCFLFDDVAFAHVDEKPGMAKRRKMVALKLGIVDPGETIVKSMWKTDVLGKQIILRTKENIYEKDGEEIVGRPKVDFFGGYIAVENQKATPVTEEWKDI